MREGEKCCNLALVKKLWITSTILIWKTNNLWLWVWCTITLNGCGWKHAMLNYHWKKDKIQNIRRIYFQIQRPKRQVHRWAGVTLSFQSLHNGFSPEKLGHRTDWKCFMMLSLLTFVFMMKCSFFKKHRIEIFWTEYEIWCCDFHFLLFSIREWSPLTDQSDWNLLGCMKTDRRNDIESHSFDLNTVISILFLFFFSVSRQSEWEDMFAKCDHSGVINVQQKLRSHLIVCLFYYIDVFIRFDVEFADSVTGAIY